MGKRAVFFLAVVLALALPVIAPAKEVPQTVPSNDLLQFRSGGLIIGFAPEKVYMAGMGYLLTEEFAGTDGVRPVPEGGGTKGAVLSGSAGHKGSPEFLKVTYPNLWPGITAHYEARGGVIAESRYIIGPGADPGRIRLRYNGDLEIQKDGSIRFSHPTKRGYFTMSAPRAWQEIGGRRIPVAVAFHEYGDGSIGFKPEGYDRDYPLVIDPTYEWHTFYGSDVDDEGYGIAVDGSGNVYVTGSSGATWQGDGGADPLHPHAGGNEDIFILKLNASGEYQWHTFYGSYAWWDKGYGIAVGESGNVYVTGWSSATWQGDGGAEPLHPHAGGSRYETDVFILKLNASGVYQWHTFYGYAGIDDHGCGIAVDGSGNVYVTGTSDAAWQGDGGAEPLHPYSGGFLDIFILKLDSSGAYQWHTFYGSNSDDKGRGIAVDGSGSVYITGQSALTWQGDGGADPLHAHSGNYDMFILKLDVNGAYQWHTFYGYTSVAEGNGIAVDGSGNVYVTGMSEDTWQGDGGVDPLHPFSGLQDMFILKLDSSGAYQWHTFYGSGSTIYGGKEHGYGIAVDGNGNVYVTGYTLNTWQGDGGVDPLHPYSDNYDIFVLKIGQRTNQSPVIDSFTANPTAGVAPLTVDFTCQAHDPDGTIASYQWDFDGNGTVDQTTIDWSVTYTYNSAGTYQAKVTVVDNEGASTTSNTIAITVGSNAPLAANPPTPMDPIAFSWGTFPYPIPSDTPVTVAPGIISIAPKMNIPDCSDVAQPLMYAYLPDSQVGIDLSSLVIETCNNGVATFAFPDIDLSNYPGLVFDIYYGYADGAGRIFYNTYEVTLSATPTQPQS